MSNWLIVGNGPSRELYRDAKRYDHRIVINTLCADDTDIVLSVDDKWCAKNWRGLLAGKFITATTNAIATRHNLRADTLEVPEPIVANSGYCALLFAGHAGATQITLAGFDMQTKEYTGILSLTINRLRYLDAIGVRVRNLDPCSKVTL